jgi:hypothetical protein
VDLGRRGEPAGHLALEGRPVDQPLAVAEVGAVALVRDAVAGAVGVEHVRQRAGDPDEHRRERGDVRRALRVGEHIRVLLRQPEAPRLGRRVRIIDLDEAGDGLLLEPLARVALVDARCRGEPTGRERPAVAERQVETEPPADVDAEELQRADRALEEALDERVAPVCLDACHHGCFREPTLAPAAGDEREAEEILKRCSVVTAL